MTKDEILNMEAGCEIDILISNRVFKYSTKEWNKRFFAGYSEYSTDMSAAWSVVEKIKGSFELYRTEDNGWRVWYQSSPGSFSTYVGAETAPLAICRAALLAVMDDKS